MILFLRSKMDEDEEEWTDEEDNEKLVLRINRLPLSELKDIISSINPSFSFTTKDGWFLAWTMLTQANLSPFLIRSENDPPDIIQRVFQTSWNQS